MKWRKAIVTKIMAYQSLNESEEEIISKIAKMAVNNVSINVIEEISKLKMKNMKL